MNQLTQALQMDEAEIAAALGVTTRTVRAWTAGVRRPIERNRAALVALVGTAHTEHSAATNRWSAARDRALCATKLELMTDAQRAKWEADRAEMRAVFSDIAIETARRELAARRAANPLPTRDELPGLFTAAAYATAR